MKQLLFTMTFAIATTTVLAGCAYRGGDIGDPGVRKFSWFSFVGGDDIRTHCQAGMPDRFRLVYTGIYDDQLRIYEWDSLRRLVSVKVVGGGNMLAISGDDLLGPWRATAEKVQLDDKTYDLLGRALEADGAFGPPAVGLELPSRGYHWSAATCLRGHFTMTGWRYPSESFERLQVAGLLFALDPTGIAVKPPGPVPHDVIWEDKRKKNQAVDFTLKIGRDGLVGQ
jgi:hypothetical protein